jgi:hypothetical protein
MDGICSGQKNGFSMTGMRCVEKKMVLTCMADMCCGKNIGFSIAVM